MTGENPNGPQGAVETGRTPDGRPLYIHSQPVPCDAEPSTPESRAQWREAMAEERMRQYEVYAQVMADTPIRYAVTPVEEQWVDWDVARQINEQRIDPISDEDQPYVDGGFVDGVVSLRPSDDYVAQVIAAQGRRNAQGQALPNRATRRGQTERCQCQNPSNPGIHNLNHCMPETTGMRNARLFANAVAEGRREGRREPDTDETPEQQLERIQGELEQVLTRAHPMRVVRQAHCQCGSPNRRYMVHTAIDLCRSMTDAERARQLDGERRLHENRMVSDASGPAGDPNDAVIPGTQTYRFDSQIITWGQEQAGDVDPLLMPWQRGFFSDPVVDDDTGTDDAVIAGTPPAAPTRIPRAPNLNRTAQAHMDEAFGDLERKSRGELLDLIADMRADWATLNDIHNRRAVRADWCTEYEERQNLHNSGLRVLKLLGRMYDDPGDDLKGRGL